MFASVRSHYRDSGELDEVQVCRNMMVTRVDDFAQRICRCRVGASDIHGNGLFATRSLEAGELITFFPGDALLIWEDGDRTGDMMMFFGAHIPQEERDAKQIASERVKSFELYSSAQISAVGDPTRCVDPAYLGHLANDAATCDAPEQRGAYELASADGANAEACTVEACHFALRATRPIAEGEEILFTYGAGYWLARAGHAGSGSDLPCVGSPAPERSSKRSQLQRAIANSRPAKKASKPKAKRKASAAKTKKSAPRGFGGAAR